MGQRGREKKQKQRLSSKREFLLKTAGSLTYFVQNATGEQKKNERKREREREREREKRKK